VNEDQEKLRDELRSFARKTTTKNKKESSFVSKLTSAVKVDYNEGSDILNVNPKYQTKNIEKAIEEFNEARSKFNKTSVIFLVFSALIIVFYNFYNYGTFFSNLHMADNAIFLLLDAVIFMIILLPLEKNRKTAYIRLQKLYGLSEKEAEYKYWDKFNSD
jgi:uncharacterized ion transporter superfamily protein YfcC